MRFKEVDSRKTDLLPTILYAHGGQKANKAHRGDIMNENHDHNVIRDILLTLHFI